MYIYIMPRCPNGTRKNRKTGNCEPNSTMPAKKKSPTETRKKTTAKKITLDDHTIDFFIKENAEYIQKYNDTEDNVRAHLKKTYYKPGFKSNYYPHGEGLKSLKKHIISTMHPGIKEVIKKEPRFKTIYVNIELLKFQIEALFRSYSMGDYNASDFSSSDKEYY